MSLRRNRKLHIIALKIMAAESSRTPVEIWHCNVLFARESYEVVNSEGEIFNPCKYQHDFRKAFQSVLSFWQGFFQLQGDIFEFEFVDIPKLVSNYQAKCNSIMALVTIYQGHNVEEAYRRVNTFEGVLDCHCQLANKFAQSYPDIGFWCLPENITGHSAWRSPTEKDYKADLEQEWIDVCKKKPHLRDKALEYEMKGYCSPSAPESNKRWFEVTQRESTQDTTEHTWATLPCTADVDNVDVLISLAEEQE